MDISSHISYEMRSAIERCIDKDREAGNLGEIDHIWIRAAHFEFSRLNFSAANYGQFAVKHFFDIIIKNSEQNFGNAACGFVSADTFIPIDLFATRKFRRAGCELANENFINGITQINPEKIDREKFLIWLHPAVSFIVDGYCYSSIANIVKCLINDGQVLIPQVSVLIKRTFKIVVSHEPPKSVASEENSLCATVDKDGWIVGQREPTEVSAAS